MLRRRVLPCLDVRGGRLVKGVEFVHLRDCGDPVDAAGRYAAEGADEIVWLNIEAGAESWLDLLAAVREAADRVDVPLCVGGGVAGAGDARDLLLAGADKVTVNTAALARPELVSELAEAFGSQSVVVAIDAARENGGWTARAGGGRVDTGRDAVGWAVQAAGMGAGELLVTSIDHDGGLGGYDLELVSSVSGAVGVPVIASGGAGAPADLAAALAAGADAALAASIFHDGRHTIGEVKREVAACGLPVRT